KILELPVTATQDYTLFHILNSYSIDLWKRQISLIRERNGLISFIVHPDYIIDEDWRRVYKELLTYLSELRSKNETWIALPAEVNEWWRQRSEMKLAKSGGTWHIEGLGQDRARIAYAILDDEGTLRYEVERSKTLSR